MVKSLLKTMLLLCALVAGSGSVWAQETTVATFDSDVAVDNSAYATTYGGSDWSINMGGNNKSIGFNNKNCKEIGDALGTGAKATNYGVVVKSKNKLSNVNKITFVYTGGSGDGGKIYLASSENGTEWSAIGMSVGSDEQGTTVSQNTTLTFEFSTISSAYYGIILDSGGTTKAAYRFDYVTINFINVPTSSSAAEKPTFNPASSELTKVQNVTISSTGAAKIIYTTNGDEPTIGGATTTTVNAATASVLVNGEMTIKAKGVDSSNELSQMGSASYTINLAEPEILPAERTYATSTDVSFTQDDDIDVYYTLDDTTPTASSTKYDGTPFAITENLTIKAIAIDEYGNESDVVEAKFKNSDLQNTEIAISNWNTLFGTSFTGSLSGTDIKDYNGTIDNLSVVYGIGSASNMYMKNTEIRLYNGSTLSFTAPSGYAIKKVVFTGTISNDKKPTVVVGAYDNSTKTWTGFAKEVVFTGTATSANIATATITLAQKESITVTDAGFATYVSDADLDYSGLGVKAYRATVNGTTISFENVTTVPAGAGVLLQGAGTFNVPVAASAVTAWDKDDNAFVRGKGVAVETDNGDGKYNYILNKVGDVVGFYKAAGQTVAKNRAYLQSTSNAARIALNLEDETAGVDATLVNSEERTVNSVYDLQGRRVSSQLTVHNSQLKKGLYIVNGKKVIKN